MEVLIEIKHRQKEGVFILDLNGKLRANTEFTFWKSVQEIVVEKGARKVILNFAKVKECDSYGISEVLRVQKSMQNLRGRLILVELNELVTKVMHLTKVEEILQIEESEAVAMSKLALEA